MRQYEVGPPQPGEIDTLSFIGSWAFANASPAEMLPWMERIGQENLRVVREQGKAIGSLGITWMGQWFGGVPVPSAGIAAVSIAPDRRGYGAATHLMSETLKEVRARGFPLSVLYPATQPVYRAVGYEQAGSRFEIRLPADTVEMKDRELAVEAVGESEREALNEVYRGRARRSSGNLERNDFIWGRVFRPRGEPPHGYKVIAGDRIEGYVFLTKQLRERNHADFTAVDLVALTPAAGRRILTLFADHRSLAGDFVIHASPFDPIWMQLREQAWQSRLLIHWMLRIVNVPAALEARGYPEGLTAELHLAISDPLFPENAAPLVLQVSGGKGQVRPGGRGSFKAHVRGLAALYSGFQTPAGLEAAGLLDAPAAQLATAATLFAGPMPWMSEMF